MDWGTRHTMVILACFGFICIFSMRAVLSVTIVAMVKHDNFTTVIKGHQCAHPNATEEEQDQDGDFSWDSQEQGLILGSFFYGYVCTLAIAGRMAERFSGKWIFCSGVFFSAVFNLLSPWMAFHGKIPFMICRIGTGLAQGAMFPSMHALIAEWIPSTERGMSTTIVWGGCKLGSMIAFCLSGFLTSAFGWESVFYVFGGCGMIWSVLWAFLCFDSPGKHPRISKKELAFITTNLPPTVRGKDLPSPPYKKVLTSLPFLAICIAHIGHNWGVSTLFTQTPSYLSNIQHFSIKENGVLSSIPYAAEWAVTVATGALADLITRKKYMSKVNMRRFFNTIGALGPALGLLWLSFVDCDRTMAVVALSVAVGLSGAVSAGFFVNHVDLSPNYSGSIFGITGTASQISTISAPYMTGAITNKEQSIESWRIVFLTAASIFVCGNLIYVIFASGSIQPWNTYWEDESEDKSKKKESITSNTIKMKDLEKSLGAQE